MRIFIFKKKTIAGLFLLIIALLLIPIIAPFFHRGFFPTHDDVQTVRIFESYQAIKFGGFPLRWSSGLLYGHGYPLFIFYPPLPYLIGAGFVFLGANFLIATKIVFLLAFFLGALGMFLLIKDLFGKIPALTAAIVFSYAPYRAVDVYVRGNLAEFFAFSLFPFVLWTNWRLLKNRSFVWLPLFSLSLALLSLTHNISFVLFIFFLGLFNLIVFLDLDEKKTKVLKVFGGVLLAAMLSCFFWLPLINETQFVNLGNFSSYPYEQYFVELKQLWDSPWGYGGFLKEQPMSLQIGKTLIIFSITAFVLGFFRKRDFIKKMLFLFTSTFFFSILMTTKYSSLIWKNLPFLAFFQFPWRFHLLITFCGAVLNSLLVYYLDKNFKKRKVRDLVIYGFAVVVIILTIIENYGFFRPKLYWRPLSVSETTTWDDEYLPRWVKIKPKNYEGEKIKIIDGKGEIKNTEWGYLKKDFIFIGEKESSVELAHIYYPGWKAFVNGEKKEIDYQNDRGLMRLQLPEGRSFVQVRFLRTPVRLIAEIISTIGLFILVFLFFNGFKKCRIDLKHK